jgi:hypothetical protein
VDKELWMQSKMPPKQTEQTPDWENKGGQNICAPHAQESQLTINVPELLIVSEDTKFLLHTVLTNLPSSSVN